MTRGAPEEHRGNYSYCWDTEFFIIFFVTYLGHRISRRVEFSFYLKIRFWVRHQTRTVLGETLPKYATTVSRRLWRGATGAPRCRRGQEAAAPAGKVQWLDQSASPMGLVCAWRRVETRARAVSASSGEDGKVSIFLNTLAQLSAQ